MKTIVIVKNNHQCKNLLVGNALTLLYDPQSLSPFRRTLGLRGAGHLATVINRCSRTETSPTHDLTPKPTLYPLV